MKRFLLILCLIIFAQPVFAKTISVKALENFSSENPPKYYSVEVLQELLLDADLTLKEGDILKGEISDVQDPKRLKRDATFTFIPLYLNNEKLNGDYFAKYTTKIDKGQLAKSAVLGAGNYFVKGLSLGYNAIEGAVKNEKDNRFKSTISSVYENSPLSYVEKGEALEILKNQIFFLNFKVIEENLPNYEYQELD